MIRKFLIYALFLFFTSSVLAQEDESKINIQYDGIYLRNITLSQLEMVYHDYKYRDYIYMPEWKYPPIFLENFPIDFDTITDPQKRNKLFIQILVPLTLKLNQEILQERWEIEDLIKEYNEKHDLSEEQIKYLEDKATKYDIFTRLKGERRYSFFLNELKEKVDIIPPSILIAAAAIETNWGTNRPAQLANSLFRELVWYTDEGLEPLDEEEDKSYRYKIFPTLYDSLVSHALKINSSINYYLFRTERAQIQYKEVPVLGRNIAHSMVFDSNLRNFAGILDYTITFYELTNIDEAELAPLTLPASIDEK